jgi:hexosaminidase
MHSIAEAQTRPADELSIIPKPVSVKSLEGKFTIDRNTVIVVPSSNPETKFASTFLLDRLRRVTGYRLKVLDIDKDKVPNSNFVLFSPMQDSELGREGYLVESNKDRVLLEANTSGGFLYAVQTLMQMLPPDIWGSKRIKKNAWMVPGAIIRDLPRFQWRGMHLDVSRHFFPKSFIKTYIDMLAMHKLNVFHWHLCDDQGWRLQIMRYPRLTSVGAWRVDREKLPWEARPAARKGERASYGGFYTQSDVREIVAYAAQRNVTIVPEIEMPAHCTAALASYPEYSCSGKPPSIPPGGIWPCSNVYCAGNDSTFVFMENVLSEVMDMFPSTFIHIGGDEADKSEWMKCPRCNARMKKEGLKDGAELQSWFIKRIERFLLSKGRMLIGWDEILEGGLAPEATVMSWRGTEGGVEAARQGHDVVMTPGSYCYFDRYQGHAEYEPPAGGGRLSLSKVYSYEPVPDGLTKDEARHVLGAQACVWAENIPTPSHAQYMTLPRMAAMCEVLWSPKEERSWSGFVPRVDNMMERYARRGWNYAKSVWATEFNTEPEQTGAGAGVSLSNEMGGGEIHYTLDGSAPKPKSPLYTQPFKINESTTVRAAAFRNGKALGAVTHERIDLHKAVFKTVRLGEQYTKYTGGGEFALVNTKRGTVQFDDGNWQGFEGVDFNAVIDLHGAEQISSISTVFLEDQHSWIFPPVQVDFAVSIDGFQYTPVASFSEAVQHNRPEKKLHEYRKDGLDVQARYVRVKARHMGTIPDWHVGKGGKGWLFVDEIVVR